MEEIDTFSVNQNTLLTDTPIRCPNRSIEVTISCKEMFVVIHESYFERTVSEQFSLQNSLHFITLQKITNACKHPKTYVEFVSANAQTKSELRKQV